MKINNMNFAEQVELALGTIFQEHGFYIVESSKNHVQYSNNTIIIELVYSPYEYLYILYIGRSNKTKREFWDKVMKHLLGAHIQFDFSSLHGFLRDVKTFFEGAGKGLLNGDLSVLDNAEEYIRLITKEYNDSINRNSKI